MHRALAVTATIAALSLPSGCGESVVDDRTPGARATDEATTSDPFESNRLDCIGGRSTIWTTDPGTPPPGQTVDGALRSYPGAEVVQEGATSAVAVVRVEGRVVETLVLARWAGESGGWFVESGAECLLR